MSSPVVLAEGGDEVRLSMLRIEQEHRPHQLTFTVKVNPLSRGMGTMETQLGSSITYIIISQLDASRLSINKDITGHKMTYMYIIIY